jgi:hypothetical protein
MLAASLGVPTVGEAPFRRGTLVGRLLTARSGGSFVALPGVGHQQTRKNRIELELDIVVEAVRT